MYASPQYPANLTHPIGTMKTLYLGKIHPCFNNIGYGSLGVVRTFLCIFMSALGLSCVIISQLRILLTWDRFLQWKCIFLKNITRKGRVIFILEFGYLPEFGCCSVSQDFGGLFNTIFGGLFNTIFFPRYKPSHYNVTIFFRGRN